MMATLIRPELSTKNKYWISKHRHYELKHFCLQYPIWKSAYAALDPGVQMSVAEKLPSTNLPGDPSARMAIKRAYYSERIDLIERIAEEADKQLCNYILKAVTEGLSYTYLKARLEIPCGRDMFYDRYRRFFWLLNKARQ